MNERIEQLKSQCWVEKRWDNDMWIEKHIDLEKFAELIVRECITVINQPNGVGDDDVIRITKDVEKHFGVNSNEITAAMLDTAINQIEEYKKYVAQQQKENLPHISYSSWELYNKPKKEQE